MWGSTEPGGAKPQQQPGRAPAGPGCAYGRQTPIDIDIDISSAKMANVDFRVLQRGRPSETDPEGHQ